MSRAAEQAGGAPSADADGPQRGEPMLSKLNARGFRLVMIADAIVLAGIMVLTMVFRFGLSWPPGYSVVTRLALFGLAVCIFLATFYLGGLYEREPRLGAPPVLPRAAGQTLVAAGLVALVTLALGGAARELGWAPVIRLPIPTTNLGAMIPLGAAGVATNRWLVQRLRTRREGPPKVVLVGGDEELGTARSHLQASATQAIVVGEVTEPELVLASVEDVGATDVLLLSRRWLEPLYPTGVESLERQGITVLLRVGAHETMFGLERLREIGGMPFVLLRSQTVPRSRARLKRLFDLALLALAAPVVVPLLVLLALYQRIVAGPSIFYWQRRVGAQGRTFDMVKFRTMRPDAEADDRGARLAERDDPRVIPACRWLRATRMDELPQVWNVLRGDMSLVGPRPERPELTTAFDRAIPGYGRRHELPPGITGLAQIHGRYHTDAEYKLGYDLHYLVNWSPVLDLQILAKTVWVVLTRRL